MANDPLAELRLCKVVIDNGDQFETTFGDILDANDFEPDEIADMIAAIKENRPYVGGGGAAAEWSMIRKIDQIV